MLWTHQDHHLHWNSHHLMHWQSHHHLPWYLHVHHRTHEPQSAGTYVGRVGMLAVALGIGTAVAGGLCATCATATADTGTNAADDSSTSQSVNAGPRASRVKSATATSIGGGSAASSVAGNAQSAKSVRGGSQINLNLPDDAMVPAAVVAPVEANTGGGHQSPAAPAVNVSSPAAASTPRAATVVDSSLSEAITVAAETQTPAAKTTFAPGRRVLHGAVSVPSVDTPSTATPNAGTPSAATTTSSTATAVEGEKMTLSRTGVGRVVSDKNASSGSALAITGNVTASTTVNIPTGTTGLIIRAKSTGGPNMTLAVDGVAVTTLMVVSSGYTDFTFAGVVPAGQHVISVASTTATTSATLYLDKISTMSGPIIDHFTGKSGSAPSDPLWSVRSGSGLDAGIQTYTTSNVYVDGQSHLVIQAVRGKTAGTYTSGLVSSKNDVSYGYGTVTARIKVPKGQGIWPAFWMMGADSDIVGWPASGEIDVFEMPSTTTTVYSTLHGPISGTTATQQAQIVSTMPDLSADYHNYWVRRLPNEVTFGIDDKTLGTLTPESLGPGETWVYNRPMYVLLNVAVGGSWAGAPNSSTVFPAKMLVDWVRWDPPA